MPILFCDFAKEIEQRKKDLGITDDMIENARNSGKFRTKEKREFLKRIQQRAKDAGLTPYKANF